MVDLTLTHVLLLLLAVQAAGNNYHAASSYPDPGSGQQGQPQQLPPQQYSYPHPPSNLPQGQFESNGPSQQGQSARFGPGYPPQGTAAQYPPGYGSNPMYRGPPGSSLYGQQSQQQPQPEGLFSKLKNSLFAAGTALTNSLDFQGQDSLSLLPPPPSQQQQYPPRGASPPPGYTTGFPGGDRRLPPGYPANPQGQPAYGLPRGDLRGPPTSLGANRPAAGYPGSAYDEPAYQQQQVEGEGLLSKVKGFFAGDERPLGQQQQPHHPQQYRPNPPPAYPSQQQQQQQQQPLKPMSVATGMQQQQQPPVAYQQQQQPPAAFGGFPPRSTELPGQPTQQFQPQGPRMSVDSTGAYREQQAFPGQSQQPPSRGYEGFPPPQGQQQQQSQQAMYGPPAPLPPSTPPASSAALDAPQDRPIQQEPQRDPLEWLQSVPTEPQVLVHEDAVVFILKPQQFLRKKAEMTAAGPQALQVLTDFEHVCTRFKNADGSRALGTAELLESAGCVHSDALHSIQRITEDFDRHTLQQQHEQQQQQQQVGEEEEDEMSQENNNSNKAGDSYAAFEDMTQRCQQALCTQGHLQYVHVAPATRALLPQLGLRDGVKDALSMLAQRAVPAYVFSSGYGDVVSQALLAAGLSSTTTSTSEYAASGPQQQQQQAQHLPNNLRIIANFFRTAPDGTVRAFSNPMVHERNKNATTASRVMGMPVPKRPYALVLAAHEDDVTSMVDGLGTQLQDTLSIGYMELTDDLPQRLPLYLQSFDAVVVNDASFKYVASLLEDILQVPVPSKLSATQQQQSGALSKLPSLGFGLRKGLGMLLQQGDNNNNNNNNAQNVAAGHIGGAAMHSPLPPMNLPPLPASASAATATAPGAASHGPPAGYAYPPQQHTQHPQQHPQQRSFADYDY